MAVFNRECKVCGDAFATSAPSKVYCSGECVREGRRILERFKTMKKSSSSNLAKERARIEREARALGMHYGQYVALKGL